MLWGIMLILVVSYSCALGDLEPHDEKRLTSRLLEEYEFLGVQGRPVVNSSTALPVYIRFSLVQVLEIDPQVQVFDFVGWVYLKWNDSMLTWNPSDFPHDLQTIVIPSHRVWTPDIVIQNTIEAVTPFFQANLRVNFKGEVQWVMQYHFKATCGTLPHQRDPRCALKFGSWAYSENEVSLRVEKDRVDTSYYVPDHTWELQQTKAEKNVLEYSCCPDTPYGDVTYTLNFRRRHRPEDNEDKDKDNSSTRARWSAALILLLPLVLRLYM